MKHKLSIVSFTLVILLCHSLSLKSQKIEIGYTYDNAGNCTGRKVIPLTKSNIDSIATPKVFQDREINVKIYPNPTRGQLKVEIPEHNNGENIGIALYNLSGKMIHEKKYKDAYIDIDLSGYASGTYILRMQRAGKYSSWKIIKID